ncbi:hypothetical protein Bestia_00144 [Acinetobacter phage Bestia]|nr:hypothetical protein Bestia_00144 [Acinetobacter phage Bestia]
MSLAGDQDQDKGKGLQIEELHSHAPKYATHYEIQGNEVVYYAKDQIGRWCYVDDDSGGGWPTHSDEWDRLDNELKPL